MKCSHEGTKTRSRVDECFFFLTLSALVALCELDSLLGSFRWDEGKKLSEIWHPDEIREL